jgi:hypothetical protein
LEEQINELEKMIKNEIDNKQQIQAKLTELQQQLQNGTKDHANWEQVNL